MRVNRNGVLYEIEIGGTYNFYDGKVKAMYERDGFIVYKHEQSGYNICEIEEFAEQNPEIVSSVKS